MMQSTPSYEGIKENLEELRSQLTSQLSYILLGASVFFIWIDFADINFPTPQLYLWGLLLAVSLGVRGLLEQTPKYARYLLVWGSALVLGLSLTFYQHAWIPFLILPLLILYALLANGSQVLIGLGFLVEVFVLAYKYGYDYPNLILFIGIFAGIMTAWSVQRVLFTALDWAWTSQRRADELLHLARDRQGELNQTLKSLELSYDLQKKTQQQLYLARQQAEEARQTKERFAANISHELRTPLSLILGFSEIMYLSPEVYGDNSWPPALQRDIYHIYRNSRHLMGMIDDILDLSRFDIPEFTLNKESTSIADLIRGVSEIASDLFRAKDVELVLEIEDGLPNLEIDRTRIRQVFLNLLNNAQRFTDQGVVNITAARVNNEVLITVRDTGAGIPEDKLGNIFDEFYQIDYSTRRSHEGTGLGLAICKRFVEAHRGRIWVESQVEVGSTFSFTLPIPTGMDFEIPASVYRRIERDISEEQPAVLLIDPDAQVSALVQNHLSAVRVIPLADEDQLHKLVKEYQPKAILKNSVPDKIDAADRIGDESIPIIRYSLPSQFWLSADLGVKNIITKPIKPDKLLSIVEDLGNIKKILIVDDDRGFCHLVNRILQTSDKTFETQFAFDGEEGLVAMREFQPDLLLLDLIMPEIDGIQMINLMRADPAYGDVPVILLTATNYFGDAIIKHGSGVFVWRQEGMSTSETLSCLKGVIDALGPSFPAAN
jgi:signal transduction histidine kinase/CheY-like chemotaxis protein